MRHNTRAFVADVVAAATVPGPVVEFGSYRVDDADLADLRPLFAGRDFTGCDMRPGPGVDRIENLLDLSFAERSIGTIVALDTLEHVTDCHTALREMYRVLQPGGWVVISSVMFFPIHDHPSDYWRFTPSAFDHLLADFDDRAVFAQGWELMPHTVLGVATKGTTIPSHVKDLLAARHQRDDVTSRFGVRLGPLRIPITSLAREVARQFPGELRRWTRVRRRR